MCERLARKPKAKTHTCGAGVYGMDHVQLHPQYMPPVYMNNHSGASILGQNVPYQVSAHSVPAPVAAAAAAPVAHSAAPPLVYSPPVMMPAAQYLYPVGVMNGHVVYSFSPPAASAAPSKKQAKKKRKKKAAKQLEPPYIKKPRNAYICFVDEQRQNVAAELHNTNNSAVNAVLGQRWRNMSDEEQARYYRQARSERQLHAQQHPSWSCKDNYGKKRKRQKRSGGGSAAAAAPRTEEEGPDRCATAARELQADPYLLDGSSSPSPNSPSMSASPADGGERTGPESTESLSVKELQNMVDNLDSLLPHEWFRQASPPSDGTEAGLTPAHDLLLPPPYEGPPHPPEGRTRREPATSPTVTELQKMVDNLDSLLPPDWFERPSQTQTGAGGCPSEAETSSPILAPASQTPFSPRSPNAAAAAAQTRTRPSESAVPLSIVEFLQQVVDSLEAPPTLSPCQ